MMREIPAVCAFCGKRFWVGIHRWKHSKSKRFFCNPRCHIKFERPDRIRKGVYFECRICGKEFYVRPYRAKNKNVIVCSKKCLGIFNRGSRYEFWKKQSPILKKLRTSKKYKDWRYRVFERDDYRCILCNKKGYLIAHHLLSFAFYPKYRFDVRNGITVCEDCHNRIHNKALKRKQNLAQSCLEMLKGKR